MTNALTGAALAAGAGALLAGCGSGGSSAPAPGNVFLPSTGASPTPSPSATPLDPNTVSDFDILNFALNLEYLEAEFYLRAIGESLTTAESGGSAGTVTGGRAVNFTSTPVRQYAQEIANDERNHVRFLRSVLAGNAVAKPNINFTDAFNAAARAIGLDAFDPFADQTSFLLGSFVFEDVGVTAYKGAARFIDNKAQYLGAAASILAVEAIHAGLIRHLIADIGGNTVEIANKISGLRAQAGGGKDEGVTINGVPNYVVAQNNTVVYSRTFAEVLRVVYLTPTGTPSQGGFFPNGVNGNIRIAA